MVSWGTQISDFWLALQPRLSHHLFSIGPVDLTTGTLSDPLATVPTVTDNLFSHGTISTESIGVFYAPTTSMSTTNGELTFGGTSVVICIINPCRALTVSPIQ